MEFLPPVLFCALFAVIVIELVPVRGKVIAPAARDLPAHLQRQAGGVRCRGAL